MTTAKIIPIREQIADIMRSDIISGELTPGEKLNEQELAARFGVSRGPIRDVLLKLAKEGLVVSKTNIGTYVAAPLSNEMQKVLMDIRIRIEEFAVRHIEDKANENDLQALADIIDRMRQHYEREEFTDLTKADIDFHQFYVELAGGDDLLNIWYPIVMRMRMNYDRIERKETLVEEHQAILDGIKSKDSKAAIAAIRNNIK
ncbi:GntR family transcriptional regulator [Saccharobesus litoralis]|uniref:GntR family transcriptional regulator n=1 Tax=Saccharobesus litoralis TaxID=2172099 RepID=A0A2S0VNX8_9ALTE|nr:GntR family transcriptional regulator [Saccharobesus litoralis]AWB65790.1 GntR family transcriptional regulator [Saccharobesus litoralis]